MKRIFLLLAILFLSTGTFAQKEEVPSLLIVEHDFDWYKKQSKEWSDVIARDSTNEQAWRNYYMAIRYCRRTNYEEYNKKIQECLQQVRKNIPETYTGYCIEAMESGVWTVSRGETLRKAEALNPNDPWILDELIAHEVTYGTDEKLKEYTTRFFNTNHFSPAYYNYNYNVLAGLPQNAALFTSGDLDSYPVWVLQQTHNFRKDVTLINIHLLNIKEYREKVFKRLGVPVSKELDNLVEKHYQAEDRSEVQIAAIKHIYKTSKHKIHLGLTLSGATVLEKLKTQLYLTGLSYEYSEKPIENISLLNDSFKKMKLDYLEISFMSDRCEAWNKVFSINYLFPMITLYKEKKAGEEKEKLYKLIQKIAAETGKSESVNKSLGM